MDLVNYRSLYWLLVLVPLLAGFVLTLVERPRVLKFTSFVLRCLGIIFLVLAICRPVVLKEREAVHTVFLFDVSESIDLEEARGSVDYIKKKTEELRRDDSYSIFLFGSGIRAVDIAGLQKLLEEWAVGVSDSEFRNETRISHALLTARLQFPAGKAKRIVLMTDGSGTDGDLERAVTVLTEEGIEVFTHELEPLKKTEAAVVSVTPARSKVYYGERVPLTAVVSANKKMNVMVRFLNRGVLQHQEAVELEASDENKVVWQPTMDTAGISVWSVEIEVENDHFTVNNKASCTVDVKGRARVLALHKTPRSLKMFRRALDNQGIDLEVRGELGMPETMEELLQFDAVILADIPATSLSVRQMKSLKGYVSDFGCGLIMMGSENSFGLGGYYKTPVEEVLPIVSRYEKEKEQPSMAMVLVIDKSGSMTGVPIALARQAAKAAVEMLGTRDMIAVLGFDSGTFVVSEMVSVVHRQSVLDAIDGIAAGGGTSMYPAMAKARDMLAGTTSAIKHMIALGDGQSMPGDFEGIAAEMADEGMTVSTVALGGGADRALMKMIADLGKGRYYETMDPTTVPRIFTKETMEASRSAIKEEPFSAVPLGISDMFEGLDFESSPYLLGYVMTKMKPTAKILLITESGDPLMALGRYGLGKSIAFTSDATDKWGSEWISWSGFGKFWAQTLRSVTRNNDSGGILVQGGETPSDTVNYTISSRDDMNNPSAGITWEAKLHNALGEVLDIDVEEVGYGKYEAKFPQPRGTKYTLSLHDPKTGKIRTLHKHKDYPAEYMLNKDLPDEYKSLPVLGEKRLFDDSAPVESSRMMQNPSIMLAMLCFLGCILLRRI